MHTDIHIYMIHVYICIYIHGGARHPPKPLILVYVAYLVIYDSG